MEDEKYPESPIDYSEKLAEKAANCVADSKDKRGNLVLNILEGHRDKVSETLKKMKNHDIVKAVLDNPEEAFKFCFKPTGNKNEYKVNFRPIDWRLLGLGHFKEITEQFNQVQVNGVEGILDVHASVNKPGYSVNGRYLSIRNGDTVTLVENEDKAEEVLKAKRESFAKESKPKNESYIKLLKDNPDVYKDEILDGWNTNHDFALKFDYSNIPSFDMPSEYNMSLGMLNATDVGKIKSAMAWQESRGKLNIRNRFGYSGLYQFGAAALETCKFLKPGSYRRYGQKSLEYADCWVGDYSLDKFLASRGLQEQAMNRMLSFNYNLMVKKGIINSSDTKESIAGKLCQAQLGGVGNVGKSFRDGFGTNIMKYDQLGKAAVA